MTSTQEYLEEIGTLALLASETEFRATADNARKLLAERLGAFDTLPSETRDAIQRNTLKQLGSAQRDLDPWFRAEVHSLCNPAAQEHARAFTWALSETCRRFLMEQVLHIPVPKYKKRARMRIAFAH